MFKKLLIYFICCFIPSKNLRERIREWGIFPKIKLGDDRPYGRRIPMAFCFDNAFWEQAGVAIISLLANSRCDYDIYCVVPPDMPDKAKKRLAMFVEPTGSSIVFLAAGDGFKNAKPRNAPKAMLYRLLLADMLPGLDRIIYADCDVCFCRGLAEADEIELGDNLVAGVAYGGADYINSGFLIMNLKKIREEGLLGQWRKMLEEKQYPFPDQDAINITCRQRKLLLPMKFNFIPYEYRKIRHGKMCGKDWHGRIIMLHFAAGQKPWLNRTSIYAPLWQKYATASGLF